MRDAQRRGDRILPGGPVSHRPDDLAAVAPAAGRAGAHLGIPQRGWQSHAGKALAGLLTAALGCFLAPAMAPAQSLPAVQPQVRAEPKSGGWSVDTKQRAPAVVRPRATMIRVTGTAARTSVRVEVTHPIVASMFTLGEPYRAIVDIPDLEFQLPAGSGKAATGLVSAFRYGQFEAGRSRVVIDLAGPATIEKAMFVAPSGKEPGILSFDLVRVGAADFKAMRGPASDSALDATPTDPRQLRGARHEEPTPGSRSAGAPKQRPVVVIDPGHGGIDPGTVAAQGLTEKVVTLAVAMQVRNLLAQSGRYDVLMTRQGDTFVSLDQRVRFARQHQADLFVSIHADSLAEKDQAQAVRGATVYILSERASDDTARRLAEKENAADVIAGLAAVPQSAEDQVRSILLDLVQRETANYSASFRSLLLGNMQGRVPLAKDPQRSAAFKVLRQPEVPSVLIELGYMSNSEDLARLRREDGQKQIATSIAAAVDAFFAKRDAKLNR